MSVQQNQNPAGPIDSGMKPTNAGTETHTGDPAGQTNTLQSPGVFLGIVKNGSTAEGTGFKAPIDVEYTAGAIVSPTIMTIKQEKLGITVQHIKNPA